MRSERGPHCPHPHQLGSTSYVCSSCNIHCIVYEWASQAVQRWRICLPVQEMQVQSLDWEDPLAEEMETHSSILAWKIPWIKEPGSLQSIGPQRARHNWVTEHVCIVYIIQLYIILHYIIYINIIRASQVVLMVRNLPANAGDIRDVGLIPGLGRSPGGGCGNQFQYSYLENPMDRGAWWAIVHGVSKRRTRLKWLIMHARVYIIVATFVLYIHSY